MSSVVDASIGAKWFLSEADSVRAAQLLYGPQELIAPMLLRVELAAAISRQFRLGLIDEKHAQRRFQDMRQIVSAPGIKLVDDDLLLARAMEIALQIRHPLQDCLYVAFAEMEQAELITADATLLKRAAPHFPFVRAL
jgi:predicted nucleic acid-binding protein